MTLAVVAVAFGVLTSDDPAVAAGKILGAVVIGSAFAAGMGWTRDPLGAWLLRRAYGSTGKPTPPTPPPTLRAALRMYLKAGGLLVLAMGAAIALAALGSLFASTA